jgi:uncharacterized protein (TIGR02452 family)
MNRNERTISARDTVAICEAGFYELANGARVNITKALAAAKAGTKLYSPEKLATAVMSNAAFSTCFEVRNETTFQALARLSEGKSGHIACLNFASAKNPGGGFLNGAIAQEEALASASGLYPCLLHAPDYYSRNRANRSTLYLDLAIFSPLVPFFRNDAGKLLAKPILASVITAPAPNAGAIAQNEPENLPLLEETLRRRAELVLGIAAAEHIDQLVLGAWGCGVFRNDPRLVARVFADLLIPTAKFGSSFSEVTFAVFDRSENAGTYKAFASAFEKTESNFP